MQDEEVECKQSLSKQKIVENSSHDFSLFLLVFVLFSCSLCYFLLLLLYHPKIFIRSQVPSLDFSIFVLGMNLCILFL